jgi:hypothetical protein
MSRDAQTSFKCHAQNTFRYSVSIRFPVVAYPENRIPVPNSFVFLCKILYSHCSLQFIAVALKMLNRGQGKGLIQEARSSSIQAASSIQAER